MKSAAFFLIILFSLPALAGESDGDRKKCIQHHRDRELNAAVDCYYRLIRRGDADKDPDLHRLRGAAYALQGKRVEAYWCYQRYVEKCPKCMYASAVNKILKDYVEYSGGPPPEQAGEGRPSPISVKRTAKAKALLDKAQALKKHSPAQARGLVEDAAWLVPKGHPLWKRIRALRAELYAGGTKKTR